MKKTIDQGNFPDALREPKRTITPDNKLKVVQFYLEQKNERDEIFKKLEEPRPSKTTRAVLKQYYIDRKNLKKSARRNLQKLCAQKFPEIVKRCKVDHWRRKAELESWHDLPAEIQCGIVETPNSWRKKLGLPLKGHKDFGQVPLAIQRELDLLMMEASSGLSAITERKEIVTVENIVARLLLINLFWCFTIPWSDMLV